MTEAQEIFNTVYKHLLTQNSKSMNNETFGCYYRRDALKCAVGVLIPDDEYSPHMEERTVAALVTSGFLTPQRKEQFAGNLALLRDLQDCHDSTPVDLWPARLVDIAQQHGLEVPQ